MNANKAAIFEFIVIVLTSRETPLVGMGGTENFIQGIYREKYRATAYTAVLLLLPTTTTTTTTTTTNNNNNMFSSLVTDNNSVKYKTLLLIPLTLHARVRTIPVLEYWVLANTCRYWVVLVLAQYFLQ